jgi:hypothetical protein
MDKNSLLKRTIQTITSMRSLWNPKKRIRLIFTCPGTIVAEAGNFLKGFPLGSLYYDEAHELRNGVKNGKLNTSKHKRSKFMFELSERIRKTHYRNYPVFALTGTPIFNDEEDIISIFHFLGQKPECEPEYFEDKTLRLQRLNAAREKYVIRGLKANLLDLPDKFECTHYFHFSKRELQIAENLNQQLQMLNNESLKLSKEIGDGDEGESNGNRKNDIQNKMRAVLLRMRQQCLSEKLIKDGEYIETLYDKMFDNNGDKNTKEKLTDDEHTFLGK